MSTPLEQYLAAGMQAMDAHRDLVLASVALAGAAWAQAVAPFYSGAADVFEMFAKIALPRMRAADVVEFSALRDARRHKAQRRTAALQRG